MVSEWARTNRSVAVIAGANDFCFLIVYGTIPAYDKDLMERVSSGVEMINKLLKNTFNRDRAPDRPDGSD
jgi:hypothetical protein